VCLSGWLRTNGVRRDGHPFANCYFGLLLFDENGKLLSVRAYLNGYGTSA
jgi:hypothetical protein